MYLVLISLVYSLVLSESSLPTVCPLGPAASLFLTSLVQSRVLIITMARDFTPPTPAQVRKGERGTAGVEATTVSPGPEVKRPRCSVRWGRGSR